MRNLKLISLLIVLTLNSYVLSSQSSIDTTLLSINDTVHHFYVIKNRINMTTAQFVSNTSVSARLGANNQFSLLSERIDSLKNKHQKFQQKLNGVSIEFSKIIFHSDKNNRLTHINGVIENKIGNINTTPSITNSIAVDLALNYSVNKKFIWLDSIHENNLKEQTQTPNSTSYPTTELVITKINSKIYNVPENYLLAYKIGINYADGNALYYYINGLSSKINSIQFY